MALLRAVTFFSLCLLLRSSHAIPYLKPSADRFGDSQYHPHGWKRALIHHVSNRAFTSQPAVSRVIRLFANRNTAEADSLQATLPSTVGRQALVGEQCSSDSDCLDLRQCITVEDGGAVSCTTVSDFCVCFSPILTCSSEEDCDSGEVCTELPQGLDNLCVSEEALASINISVTDTGSGTVSLGSEVSPLIEGLTGDSCSSDSDCTGSRECLFLLDAEAFPCSGRENCVCIQEDPSCSSDSDCESGEFCQFLDEGASFGFCIAAFLVPGNPAAQAANEEAGLTSLEDEEPTPSEEVDTSPDGIGPSDQKLNFEICQSMDECAGMRMCGIILDSEFMECSGQTDCRCLPLNPGTCISDDECDIGESCILLDTRSLCISDMAPVVGDGDSEMSTEEPGLTDEPELTPTEPVPTDEVLESESNGAVEASQTPEADQCETDSDCADGEVCEETDGLLACEPAPNGDEDSTVCIAAHHLSHMSQDELLYSTHRVARVLCDEDNNCATPGHVIKYEGATMMMSSYCDMVGCTSKIKTVNSPRYYPGKVVKSNSDGLEFTGHAARYNTKLEERMLALAIRVGL